MKKYTLALIISSTLIVVTGITAYTYTLTNQQFNDSEVVQPTPTKEVIIEDTPTSTPTVDPSIAKELERERQCRVASDLLLEIKVLCDGVEEDQCINETEVEINKIKNREGSLSVLSDEQLEGYGIFKKLVGLEEKLVRLTNLRKEYLIAKSQCSK